MSRFSSARGSFMHIYRKHGAESVKNHTFLHILKDTAAKSKDWFPITKELAAMLVCMNEYSDLIMCLDVEPEQIEYIQVLEDDLIEGHFPDEWKRFIVHI